MPSSVTKSPHHLLRRFSITSLLGILVVAFVIIHFYRLMVISAVNELGAEFNSSIARAALVSVEPDLVQYLIRNSQSMLGEHADTAADKSLAHAIDSLIDGEGIVKVKVYSRDGMVIYSTNPSQIGIVQNDNQGFIEAIKGDTVNKLIFRDHLNPFDKETSDDNLIQTYLPVVGSNSQRPLGVFEIYSDANDVVNSAAKTELIVIPVVLGILFLLYGFLLMIAFRANATVERQNDVIAERTQTLEVLSAKLLNAQEDERKRVSEDLHEGIAQSLFAIKLGLENLQGEDSVTTPRSLVMLIQDAINQTRELAIKLRPPALDDFGALDALNNYFRQLRSSSDTLNIEWAFELAESDLPRPLKTIVFRIAQDTLNSLVRDTEADKIRVVLSRGSTSISLAIEENSHQYRPAGDTNGSGQIHNAAIVPMEERAVLSGGTFSVENKTGGTTVNTASWPV